MGYPNFERQGLPTIVCLCGSVRFAGTFRRERERLTLEGCIVVGPEIMNTALSNDTGPIKTNLDALHLRKIDLADEVFVVNVDGYIGESTRREIEHAERTGKPIRYLTPPSDPEAGRGAP